MADNPFDRLDKAGSAADANPFDALDGADDSAIREQVESDPSLKAITSQFARSRLTDMADMARNVPSLDSVGTLDERQRSRFIGGELKVAQEGVDRANAAHESIMDRRDAGNIGLAQEARFEAERRLERAKRLDEENRAGVRRTLSPQDVTALDRTIDDQNRKVEYYQNLVDQAQLDPTFVPDGQSVDDWRANLKAERQTLNKLTVARESGQQVPAVVNPSGFGEFGRALRTGIAGTVPEMIGGALRQFGDSRKDPALTDIGTVIRDFGRGVRRDTPAQSAPELLKLGEKNEFSADLKNYLAAKLGEGIGTSLPIIAGYMAGGPAAALGGSGAMGVGQMRNALEEAFAEEGTPFPSDKAEFYVYAYGTGIGALESFTEIFGMRSLTGEAKKQAARSLAKAVARGVAAGALMEGLTEGVQELAEIHGVSQVTGKAIDWPEARRRLIESTAAGAIPGAAFGTVTAAGERKHAFDLALAKAKDLGFNEPPKQPEAQPAPTEAPQEAASGPTVAPAASAPQDAQSQPTASPEALAPEAAAALDAVDAILPDGIQIDRQTVVDTISSVQQAIAPESVAQPVAEPEPAAPAVEPQAAIKSYLDEGGSLRRDALPDLAKRVGVMETELPALLDKAVEAGMLRKTAGGMYRRAAAEPAAEPAIVKAGKRRTEIASAIDEALAFGRKIAPKGTTIETFSEEFRANTGQLVDAMTSDGSIALATYAINPKGRMAHEVGHELVRRGQMSPQEMALLAERAEKVAVFDDTRRQMYREAYRARYSAAHLERILDEEAAMHLIEARVNGSDFGPQINAIIDRVLQALERIANALRGKGYQTAEDVIAAVTSGDMAKRDPVAEWMRAEDVTAVAFRQAEQAQTATALAPSRRGKVTTPDGSMSLDVEFRVVDAAKLQAASGDLQPRDRATRAASATQIQTIAARLNPDLLTFSPQSDRGAPIIDKAGVVLSGNGRVAAIDAARRMNTPGYRAYLERLRQEGFAIDGMQRPVLVREIAKIDDDARREFAIKSNQDDKLAMSPSEQARADRDLITPDALALLDPEAEAGLLAASNRPFVRAMLDKMSAGQRGGLLSERGDLTPAGAARLEGGIFAAAYGDAAGDAALVTKFVEDQETVGVRKALLGAAPSWAQMRAVAPDEFDITRNLIDAVNAVAEMRDKKLKPAEYFAQQDAFARAEPLTEQIALAFYNDAGTRAARWQRTRDVIKGYSRVAMDQGNAVGDLLGDTITPSAILESQLRTAAIEDQPVLFAMRDGDDAAQKAKAEAAGFDTRKVWYHGTRYQFDAFDPAAVLAKRAERDPFYAASPRMVFLSGDEALPTLFNGGKGGRTIKTYVKRDLNVFDGKVDGDKLTAFLVENEAAIRDRLTGPEDVPLIDQVRAGKWAVMETPPVQEWLRANGYDGFKAEQKGFSGTGRTSEILAIFDSANSRGAIRDTRAAFDPAKADSPNLLFAFAGERAKTADLEALARAKEMTANGEDRTAIWNATGWFRGVDGKWRFEIDDSKSYADLKAGIADGFTPNERWPLDHVFDHKNLRSAYPEMDGTGIAYRDFPDSYGTAFASYAGKSDTVVLNSRNKNFGDDISARSSILHELQHRTQAMEGFQGGGNEKSGVAAYNEISARINRLIDEAGGNLRDASPEVRQQVEALKAEQKALPFDPREYYKRLAGEAEARLVQKRMDLSAEQRRARPPWLDYDVPEEQQIVRGMTEPMFALRSEVEAEARPLMRAAAARGVTLPDGSTVHGVPLFALRAYHGSPHDFDKFGMEHIGKGEGAQAYGHGLYFAENEGVARWYRDKLSGVRGWDADEPALHVDGKLVTDNNLLDMLSTTENGGVSGAIALHQQQADYFRKRGNHTNAAFHETKLRGLQEFSQSGRTIEWKVPTPVPGRMYEVNIKADPEHFLDWDKPLSQQSEKVRNSLAGVAKDVAEKLDRENAYAIAKARATGMHRPELPAADPMAMHGSEIAGHPAVREAGIPGIRYLDQGSRGAGEGSYNYVVFDDGLIEIVAKDGKPVAGAASQEGVVTQDGMPLFSLRWSKPDAMAGLNTIVRDLAHDLGIVVRQGLNTPAAKDAKRKAKKAGVDLTSYFDPATGVLRVRSMSDLGAVLSAAGEAVISRFDRKGQGPGKAFNLLETLLAKHAAGLLGQAGRAALWKTNPTYSGVELMPTEREALAAYMLAAHNERLAASTRTTDQARSKRAERDMLNASRTVARIGTRKLDNAIAAMPSFDPVPLSIDDVRDYVDVRHNPSSLVTAPIMPAPTFEDQRAAFGQWFKSYLLDPKSAERQDRTLYAAFEDLIDTSDPTLMAKLDSTQEAIAAYGKADPVAIIQSMQVSPARIAATAKMWREIDRDGFLPTMADRLRQFYIATWDKTHPFYMAVRSLLEINQINSDQRLDLKAVDNAYKLLRLAPSSHAWAGRDLEDGIRPRNSSKGAGPSLVGALKAALGDDRAAALETGPGSKYAKFTAYLIARRAVKLWDQFEAGMLERPPIGASRTVALATIQTLESEQPQFMIAAEQVYGFQRNLLTLQRDAGLLTDDLYQTLMADTDYVPFLRDMSDQKAGKGKALGTSKSIIKKFRGSERDILDPVAMIAQKVYETRHLIMINDAKVALLKLAESAGPGAGRIAERLDPQQSQAMRVDLRAGLRAKAREMGIHNSDAIALVQLAQQLLGDDLATTVFTKKQMQAGAQPITWAYEKGVPVPIRLADGDLGRMMFETLESFGETHKNLLIDMMSVPTQLLRGTITSNPAFILRNMWVDGLMAWMYERTATPWVTQVKGFSNAIRETDEVKEYAANAGLMGGAATNAFEKLRLDRDVRELVGKGYQPKLWTSPSAWLSEMARHPLRTLITTSEASETGTRARLYTIAKDRAKANGLNEMEAAYEAAFFAHDYIDYSRSGSRVQPIMRVVAFFNAAMQGLDRYYRLMAAKGDFGSAWAPYLEHRMGQSKAGAVAAPAMLVGKAAIAAVRGGEIVTEADAPTLTEREREELAQSAHAWFVSVMVMGGMSLLITALFGDDERLKEIPEELRATHWVIPLDGLMHLVPKELPGLREALRGQMLRLPKAFETAWMANLVERIMLEQRQGNPRWFENYMGDLKNTLQPPMEAQALQLFYELRTGTSMFTGRDIVPTWKAERLREGQWDEYTSEFAKWMGKKADISPYYVDHTLKGLGSSWARDMLSLNVPGTPWYKDNKPDKSLDDYVIARRFLWKAGKGSDSAQKVREIMGAEEPLEPIFKRLSAPYSKLDASAATYKDYIKRRDPASASDLLDRLSPAERGFAIMAENLSGDASKYKMVHPMQRADKVLREVSSLQKEILADLVESKKKPGKLGEIIKLNASEKAAARDILIQYQMMEAHNALVLTGETGWAKRAYFDSASVLKELQAAVPSVSEEFERRMKKANVLPFDNVKQTWPALKRTIESDEFAGLAKAGEKREIAGRIRSLYGETR